MASVPSASMPDRPMRIAMLGDPNSVHVRRWVGYLASRGHELTILAARDVAIDAGYAPGIGIVRYAGVSGWGLNQVGMIASALSFRRAARRLRPDILQVHYLTLNGLRAWASGVHPRVVTVWGNDVLIDPRRSRRARFLARLALGSADIVTGISQHVLDAAVEFGAAPERTRRIHFGVDTELFAPGPAPAALRARLGLEGRRVLFSPRIIDDLYRHDVVVDALARLPGDVVLVMTRYAATPATVASLERRIATAGLEGRVLMLPGIPHAEMPDYYRLADVVVSVPESDAGPVTLVEALAAGRPVVASDLPPVREWLADLDPACLVPVGDVDATAGAIAALLARSPKETAEAAERGRGEALERADQRRTMAEMEELYRELVSAGSTNPRPGGARQ
jgi:glycosyltransferase involved in cell wall biosynthesis